MCLCMHVLVNVCICLCIIGVSKGQFPFLLEKQYFRVLENVENRNISSFPEQNKNIIFIYKYYFFHRSLTRNKTIPLLLNKILFLVFKTETKNKISNYHRVVFLGERFLSVPSVLLPDQDGLCSNFPKA